jgi:hypothetical protein
MSRSGSTAALALCVALVAGAVIALVGGVALGAWQPAGPSRPTPTPGNVQDLREYGEFLDDVRAGGVQDAFQNGDRLEVNATAGGYTVQLPPGDPDIFGDMEAAAAAGGVPMPGFGSAAGPDESHSPLSYAAFLEQVGSGRVYDVFHDGDRLTVNAVDGPKDVVVPAGANVLDDIEAAAEAGDVPAPTYTKVPAKPTG